MSELKFHFNPLRPPTPKAPSNFPWGTTLFSLGIIALIIFVTYNITKSVDKEDSVISSKPDLEDTEDQPQEA